MFYSPLQKYDFCVDLKIVKIIYTPKCQQKQNPPTIPMKLRYFMIGTRILNKIHKRLYEAKDVATELLSGLYLHFFGNMRQRLSVCYPLYSAATDNLPCNEKIIFVGIYKSCTLMRQQESKRVSKFFI